MSHYDVTDVPDYFQPILVRIGNLFEKTVIIDKYDDEWVYFHVPGLVDQWVAQQLEKNNQDILRGEEQRTFQILCAWSSSGGRGLILHYLEDPITQQEFRAGVWYY